MTRTVHVGGVLVVVVVVVMGGAVAPAGVVWKIADVDEEQV